MKKTQLSIIHSIMFKMKECVDLMEQLQELSKNTSTENQVSQLKLDILKTNYYTEEASKIIKDSHL